MRVFRKPEWRMRQQTEDKMGGAGGRSHKNPQKKLEKEEMREVPLKRKGEGFGRETMSFDAANTTRGRSLPA